MHWNNSRKGIALELRDYLRVARRSWITIVTCTTLGLLAAAALSLSLTPTYTAKTQLFVAIQGSGSVSELQQGNTFTQARVQSYAETATTPAVLQPAIDALGLQVSANQLANKISAHTDTSTVLISITAQDSSPVQAAAIAQAVANSLVAVVQDLESPAKGGNSPVKLSVVTPATAPVSPSAPNTRANLAVGLFGGLVLGLAVAILRSTLDTRVRNESEVSRVITAPILGGISYDPEAVKRPLLTQTNGRNARAESFRQIRTNLQFAHVAHKSKAVLVTSSLPGEGKTTTATNLAISLAQAGQTVVLVDADLRRPRVHDYLGLDRNAGLTTALVGNADINSLLQYWGEDNLYVLTSGVLPPNPSELLGSAAMKDLICQLEEAFDAVIIDAPPLLPVTDAAVLAQEVGGVVLVVGASRVKSPDLTKAVAALEMVEADVLGVVINLLPSKGPDSYAYTYYGEAQQHLVEQRPKKVFRVR
ncbi:polysaccharide biosynthesis tyrosine autokinase [Pseudarthrobacter enclensis]|uniref:Capsular exopolysaccharide synthesis family protein n=1 Tax=Pseudarthrobacter enclensis TaxID=993070 RepID=A0ABT9RYJ7_9MICC|nr:capsular exopolysaccharide synthesis family protein [Pseudarthrobacter enclensis]